MLQILLMPNLFLQCRVMHFVTFLGIQCFWERCSSTPIDHTSNLPTATSLYYSVIRRVTTFPTERTIIARNDCLQAAAAIFFFNKHADFCRALVFRGQNECTDQENGEIKNLHVERIKFSWACMVA